AIYAGIEQLKGKQKQALVFLPDSGPGDRSNEISRAEITELKWRGRNGSPELTISLGILQPERETRIGHAYFLYPLTVPVDIVTAPFQLLYFGPFNYLLILYCTIGWSCKNGLG
ncbi:MAG TPA: hypothetical protein PKJ30_18085, partial [Leptospiraceae bacterium]|nr:hypothetical protein [Leptospiraceae bacterium]